MYSKRLNVIRVVGASWACWTTVCWALTYDETVSGDLSDVASSTTGIGTLNVGANTLLATSGGGDFDHLSFGVGGGTQLDTIVLTAYGGASQSFTGLQNGTVWTAGVGAAVNPAVTLGWTHFGPAAAGSGAGIGSDILDNMGAEPTAVGFAPPLGSGVYTMLLQDTGGAVSYTLTFNVSAIPEPTSASLFVAAAAVSCLACKRCRSTFRC